MSQASARAESAAPAGPELGSIVAGLTCREGVRRVLEASYPGEPESVRNMRHQVTEALAGSPCAGDAIYALNEVATNAVVHSRSVQDGGEFTVAVDVFHGSHVAFTVTDQGGPWQDSGPDFYRHGLAIVREIAADVRINGGEDGRTVRVSFPWQPGALMQATAACTHKHPQAKARLWYRASRAARPGTLRSRELAG